MPEMITSIINGKSVNDSNYGTTYESRNPSNLSDFIAEVHLATSSTLVTALNVAALAHETWSEIVPQEYDHRIFRFTQLIEREADSLARIITRETGKTLARSIAEIRKLLHICAIGSRTVQNAANAIRFDEVTDYRVRIWPSSVGVVCVASHGYDAIADPAWFIIPALLCGNSVVWKPTYHAAACTRRVYELFDEAGFPTGSINLVYSDDDTLAAALEQAHSLGSLNRLCVLGPRRQNGALESFCDAHQQISHWEDQREISIAVLPDAQMDQAIQASIASAFIDAGQSDDSAGIVFVHQALQRAFVDQCSTMITSEKIGDPLANVLYGPLRDENASAAYEESLRLIEAHHRVVESGLPRRISVNDLPDGFVGDPGTGLYYRPTIVTGVRPGETLYRERIAGPVMKIVSFATDDEILKMLSARRDFTLHLYTENPEVVPTFQLAARPDLLSVNLKRPDSGQVASTSLYLRLKPADAVVSWLSMARGAHLGQINGSLEWPERVARLW
jgi:alpha-ketoglutaric semialdehyde dehydrogenase